MAVDNAAFISELNIAIPTNTDPRAEGAAQIRGTKTALKASFPNVDDVVNADAATMNAVFDQPNNRFLGEVTMYSGDVLALPEGWALCDGTTVNNYVTPDLRDRFIRAYSADSGLNVLDTGGDDTPLLSEHLEVEEHVLVEAQIPAHSHSTNWDMYREDGAVNNHIADGGDDQSGTPTTFTLDTEDAGGGQGHSHGITDSETDFDNRPAFIILAFICFVGV